MKYLTLLACGFVLLGCEFHNPIPPREPKSPFSLSGANYLVIKEELEQTNQTNRWSTNNDTIFLNFHRSYNYGPKIIAYFKTSDALEKALKLQDFGEYILIDIPENKIYRIIQEPLTSPKYKFILRRIK